MPSQCPGQAFQLLVVGRRRFPSVHKHVIFFRPFFIALFSSFFVALQQGVRIDFVLLVIRNMTAFFIFEHHRPRLIFGDREYGTDLQTVRDASTFPQEGLGVGAIQEHKVLAQLQIGQIVPERYRLPFPFNPVQFRLGLYAGGREHGSKQQRRYSGRPHFFLP
ncbi:hypothetical protein D1872_259950 [compost metagenome]